MAAICGVANCTNPGTVVSLDGRSRILCKAHYGNLMSGLVAGRRETILQALRGLDVGDRQVAALVAGNRGEFERYFRMLGVEVGDGK